MAGLLVEELKIPLVKSTHSKNSIKVKKSWQKTTCGYSKLFLPTSNECDLANLDVNAPTFTEFFKSIKNSAVSLTSEKLSTDQYTPGNSNINEIQECLGKNFGILKFGGDKVSFGTIDGKLVQIKINNFYTEALSYNIENLSIWGISTDNISTIAYSEEVLILLYNDSKLVILRYKIALKNNSPDPPIFEPIIDIFPNFLPPSSSSKKRERHLVIDANYKKFLIWWPISKDDVFPWTPKPEQRANVLLYTLDSSSKPHLEFFTKTEQTLLGVYFIKDSPQDENEEILTLEEFSDGEGKIEVVETIYSTKRNCKTSETIIPLKSSIKSHSYSSSSTKLALGSCDSVLTISFQLGLITRCRKIAFIPTYLCWHKDAFLVAVAGSRGQIQIFDLALQVMLLVKKDDELPSHILQIEPCVGPDAFIWAYSNSIDSSSYILHYNQETNLSLLKISCGEMGLCALCNYYIKINEIEAALNLLTSLQWNSEDCKNVFYSIFRFFIKEPLTDSTQYHLDNLFKIFYSPLIEPIESLWKSHKKSINLLAQKYANLLIQSSNFSKAAEIGLSLRHRGILAQISKLQDPATISLITNLTLDSTSSSEEGKILANQRSEPKILANQSSELRILANDRGGVKNFANNAFNSSNLRKNEPVDSNLPKFLPNDKKNDRVQLISENNESKILTNSQKEFKILTNEERRAKNVSKVDLNLETSSILVNNNEKGELNFPNFSANKREGFSLKESELTIVHLGEV